MFFSRSSVQGETTSPSTKPIYQLFDQTDDVRPHRRIQTDDGSSIATSLLEDKTLEGAQVFQIVFLAIRSSVGRRLRWGFSGWERKKGYNFACIETFHCMQDISFGRFASFVKECRLFIHIFNSYWKKYLLSSVISVICKLLCIVKIATKCIMILSTLKSKFKRVPWKWLDYSNFAI